MPKIAGGIMYRSWGVVNLQVIASAGIVVVINPYCAANKYFCLRLHDQTNTKVLSFSSTVNLRTCLSVNNN